MQGFECSLSVEASSSPRNTVKNYFFDLQKVKKNKEKLRNFGHPNPKANQSTKLLTPSWTK